MPVPCPLTRIALALSQADSCRSGSSYNGNLGLRVGGLFLILILCRRSRLRISEHVYTAFKFFGSGVIIATAFIHLLAPAFQALGSECLHGVWQEYDWAPAIAMIAVFGIFLVELVGTRTGASYLKRRGLRHHDPHHVRGNEVGHTGHGTHPPAGTTTTALASVETSITQVDGTADAAASEGDEVDLEAGGVKANQRHDHGVLEDDDDLYESAVAQCIGVGILEIGVIFHSFIIGLTLAVSANLGPLLAVLTFHQTFEGIGLGSRLSSLPLPHRLDWVPIVAAVAYSCTTPLGIAVGLGVRQTYNPDSAVASIVSGVLDASSAGILLWAGLVECLAHDLVFDRKMAEAPAREVAVAVFWVFLGAGLMALLGRWA
ncbi:zip-like iron-zinc transporter [Rhodotorula toruloides]|uniref:Zip-like iron-zinc transporter n=1 Tax=Rhodotorula toruloides TaxID=5286 RepID=A0A511KHT6_RHOTO|nr:zip-like iron-zinc transporter [Rhodotorula toruloides]